MSDLYRVTSKSDFVWLVKIVEDNNVILGEESVFLSVYDTDGWSYQTGLRLVHKEQVASIVEATPIEEDFFNLVKSKQELKYSKKIVDEFEITQYIHYSPKVSYEYQLNDTVLKITGFIQDNNVNFPINFKEVLLKLEKGEEQLLPINTRMKGENEKGKPQLTFDYEVAPSLVATGDEIKIPFIINTDKAEYLRSFTLVKYDGRYMLPKEKNALVKKAAMPAK